MLIVKGEIAIGYRLLVKNGIKKEATNFDSLFPVIPLGQFSNLFHEYLKALYELKILLAK